MGYVLLQSTLCYDENQSNKINVTCCQLSKNPRPELFELFNVVAFEKHSGSVQDFLMCNFNKLWFSQT